jgi:hypothetical protein
MSAQPEGSRAPHYLNNVMSRFGHHLSPNQRTNISDSMVSSLQSAKAGASYESPNNPASVTIFKPRPHTVGVTLNPYDVANPTVQQP